MKLLAKKPAAARTGSKRFRWTVGRKIAALGLAGLFAAVAVMFVQRQAIGQLADATQRTALTAWALRDGMQAAATGQALRADVYLALRATDPKDADAARATVEQDGRSLLASLSTARTRSAADPAVAARLAQVAPDAQAAVDQATALVVGTAGDPAAKRTAFDLSSGRLTASLGNLNDTLAVAASNAAADAGAVAARARSAQIWLTLSAFAAFLWAARLVSRGITRPLADCVTGLDALAAADLTAQVHAKGDDEVAQLATSFNRTVDDLAGVVRRIRESAWTLASSSDQLSATSTQMGASAEETSTQAGAVSAAAEQVSANVSTVAASAEEMSASIREIAASANEAAAVAAQAVTVAGSTNATVQQLGASSAEIGEVVKVITLDRRADEPARAERDDRGGPGGRRRARVRGRRERGEGAGEGHGARHRGDRRADRRDPGRRAGRGAGDRPDHRRDHADQRHPGHDRLGGRGADGDHERDHAARQRGRGRRRRDRGERRRRGAGRAGHVGGRGGRARGGAGAGRPGRGAQPDRLAVRGRRIGADEPHAVGVDADRRGNCDSTCSTSRTTRNSPPAR